MADAAPAVSESGPAPARFPFARLGPVVFPGPPPDQTDIAVIGGGVIGVSAALFLARAGHRVTLLEKGRIACEQSSRNWGWIRQQGRDPDELPIMIEAAAHWRAFAEQTNVDIGLRQAGVTYLAESDADLARFEAWLPKGRAAGTGTRMLGQAEVAQLIPDLARRYRGALYTPGDMRAEPWVAVPALAGIAVRAGATLVEDCAVRALDIAAGRVTGVITEAGRIACSAVILAGGAWSSLLLRRHGVLLPQLSVRATVAALDAAPMAYAGGAADGRLAFRARADGGYSVAAGGYHELFLGPDAFRHAPKYLTQLRAEPFGTRLRARAPQGFPDGWRTPRRWSADETSPFEWMRMLNPAPNAKKLRALQRDFASRFPGLGPVRLLSGWAGMIDVMPDVVPVIDHIPALPGLTVATGLSGHGFGIGPGVGRVLADLVTGAAPGHDLHRFRFARFTDGSPMRLGPSV